MSPSIAGISTGWRRASWRRRRAGAQPAAGEAPGGGAARAAASAADDPEHQRPGADAAAGGAGRAEFRARARLRGRAADAVARGQEHPQALSDSGGGGESRAPAAACGGDWDAEAELGGLEASPARSFARPGDSSPSPPVALARTDHPSVGSADGCGAPSAFGARRATVPPYFNSLLTPMKRLASRW